MWGLRRSRLRRRGRRELADHRARLAEIDGRLRAARRLHAEMQRWPSLLRCWLALQTGRAVALESTELGERPRVDLERRGLPAVTGWDILRKHGIT